MLMKLRDDGVVGLNDAVTDYMPVQVKDPYNTKRPITLRQLASHTSGLPREVRVSLMGPRKGGSGF